MDIRSIAREIAGRYIAARFRGQERGFVQFDARDRVSGKNIVIHILPKLVEGSPRLSRDLERLTRAIRFLDHPHVTRILEVAQEQGIPYMVSTALQNVRTLASQLSSEPMDVERASELIAQLGHALEYLGQKGVPHGELTPERIVIDDHGSAAIIDAGLAALAAMVGARSPETKSPYIAPEQRLPDHAPTTRADVYSLGALLYRLVTGRDPDMQPDPQKVMRANEINPRLPQAVVEVMAQAMDADPSKRYQSADDFVFALRSAVRSPDGRSAKRTKVAPSMLGEAASPTWPEPLPFPPPVEMPSPDMSILEDISLSAQIMLEEAAKWVPLPEITAIEESNRLPRPSPLQTSRPSRSR